MKMSMILNSLSTVSLLSFILMKRSMTAHSNKTADALKCCVGIPKPVKEPSKSDFTFNFGDSPLPNEWKDRITQNLNEYDDVMFSPIMSPILDTRPK